MALRLSSQPSKHHIVIKQAHEQLAAMEPMAQTLRELAGSKARGVIRTVIRLIPTQRRKVEHAPGVNGAGVRLVEDDGWGRGESGIGIGGTLPDIQMRGLAQQIVKPVRVRDGRGRGRGRGFSRPQRLGEAV